MEEDKPDPDELLKAIQKEEQNKSLGQLKIFIGMAAGVGKTYAMLEEAQQLLKEGVNVVAGTINTHKRVETEKLLEGIPIIPEKWVKYKEMVFEELDLESILQIKPQLVLVDELAHTNVPGTKHSKRWQDVIEILDAGIDVYTTLNVQHIESRKDVVESFTGIQVHETVPDVVLERAANIELVDIPPSELLQRLKEGKVYLGDQSKIAALNFFQETNLTALREIVLRFTAEKVDHDLHGILRGKGWKTREKLMVGISLHQSSEQLIRSARRLAFEQDAPWIAVYVETGMPLSDQEQSRLNRYFNLARELGAEVITTHDLDVLSAFQRIIKQRDVTRVVVGHTTKQKRSLWNFFQDSFIDRLQNENKHIDIVILRQETLTNIYQRSITQNERFSNVLMPYLIALIVGAILTTLGWLVSPFIGYKSVGFIFLGGIFILSFFIGQAPIFVAALLSALSWDLLFIPPIFQPTLSDPDDVVLVILYFIVAAVMGVLTSRLREQEQYLHHREEKMERLFEIERDIANSTNFQYLRVNVNARLESIFAGSFEILIKGFDNQLLFDSELPQLNKEKEKTSALWVFQNGKLGGWSTDTLPSSEGLYFPIKFSTSTVGVLAYFPNRDRSFSMDEMNFIQTVVQQLGIYLERTIFEERIRRHDYTRQIERMHQAIFHSLNRSFYTPLQGIEDIYHQLQQAPLDPQFLLLVGKLGQFISNIKLTVDNIITISEIESGFVHFDRQKQSLKELIDKSIEETKPFIDDHSITVQVPSQLALVPFDFRLLKIALNNLIINALEYSPVPKPINITAEVNESDFRISVIDGGPGIPQNVLPLIFEKFYHVPGAGSKGLGLGLAIVRAVVDIHQGSIDVKNLDEGGTEFTLILPLN